MISESQTRYGSFVLRQGRSRLRAENQASNRRLNFPISGADSATILTAHIVAHRDFQWESCAKEASYERGGAGVSPAVSRSGYLTQERRRDAGATKNLCPAT